MTKNNRNKAKAGPRLVIKKVVTVPARKAEKQKKANKQKNHVAYRERSSDDLSQFRLALRSPFSTVSMGARVPDSYCFPTVTYHYRSSLTVVSDSAGAVNMAVFPSPALTAAIEQGTIPAGATSFTSNSEVYYLVSPTELASKLTEYRVVTWGIRILAKDTAFTTKGKLMIAMVPTTSNAPSWNTIETAAASAQGTVTEYICGVNIAYLSTSILNLPAVQSYSMQDLLRSDLEVAGMPLNESFFDFRGTTDRTTNTWNTTSNIGDEVVTIGTGLAAATTIGRKDVASVRGGTAVMISATGLPVSTQSFDVEVIYHLEGTPNLTSGAGSVAGLIPSTQAVVNGSSAAVDKAMHDARKAGAFVRKTNAKGGATRNVMFAR